MQLQMLVKKSIPRRIAEFLLWPIQALAEKYFYCYLNSIESQGIVISYSSPSSPTAFLPLGNITGFSGPGGAASVIDVTNLSSTAHEKRMGLPNEGQFTIDINYDPDMVSHIAMRAARAARTAVEFKIALTDPTPTNIIFMGFVLGFQITGAVDDVVKASITIEIDGPTY